MPKLGEIERKGPQFIEVPSLPWLNRALNGGFVRGAVYLLAGDAGLGKTTLVNQALGDIASRGRKVLYITTEQSLGEFKSAMERVHGRNGTLSNAIVQNFYVDDSVDDIDALPKFLTRKLLTAGEEYHNIEVIAVDSVQGRGLSSNATRKYSALYEFTSLARAQGLICLLVGHITKNGSIAGPKNLEHNVDCIMYLRRAFRLRPFFIQKNRFGPDLSEPIVLNMDQRGRLVRSPLSTAEQSSVFGFSGVGEELTETQASVSVPKHGCRPELLSPFLPEKRVRQLLGVLNAVADLDLTHLNYAINCYLPRQQQYRGELDLALVVALLASYLQQPVAADALFSGELDLRARVRPPEPRYLRNLASILLGPHAGSIRTVFVAKEAAPRLSRFQTEKDGPHLEDVVQVVGVTDLHAVMNLIWPALLAESKSASVTFGGRLEERMNLQDIMPAPHLKT